MDLVEELSIGVLAALLVNWMYCLHCGQIIDNRQVFNLKSFKTSCTFVGRKSYDKKTIRVFKSPTLSGARWATAAAVYEELNSDDREIQEYHVHLNQHSGHSYQNHGHAHPMNGVVHPHSGHAHQSSGHTHESSGHPYHHHAHTHHSMVHTYHSKPRPKSRSGMFSLAYDFFTLQGLIQISISK